MRLQRLWLCLVVLLFTGGGVRAQEAGNLAWIEYQRPKAGMAKQYEEGRKQKVAWHVQRKDPRPLFVWETVLGENTGTYVVGVLGMKWTDFDEPAGAEGAESAEFARSVAPTVESVVSRIYAMIPEFSHPTAGPAPTNFSGIVRFQVRAGRSGEFRALIRQYHDALIKKRATPPQHFVWFELAYGGPANTFVLILPRNSWAEFAPPARSSRQLLEEVLGREETDRFYRALGEIVEEQESGVIRFRRDLSYLPTQ